MCVVVVVVVVAVCVCVVVVVVVTVCVCVCVDPSVEPLKHLNCIKTDICFEVYVSLFTSFLSHWVSNQVFYSETRKSHTKDLYIKSRCAQNRPLQRRFLTVTNM